VDTAIELGESKPSGLAVDIIALNAVFTNGKIAGFLDAFYSTPENLPIPIVWALQIISMQADRTPDYPKINARTLAARRAAVGDCQWEGTDAAKEASK
jgi:hypothetical protein